MKEYLKKTIEKKGLQLSLLLMIVIIIANAVLVLYYRRVSIRSSETAQHIDTVRVLLRQSDFYIFQGDVGLRGFLLQPTPEFLAPYFTAKDNYEVNLDAIELHLDSLGFDTNQMVVARMAIVEYMQALQLMVDLKTAGSDQEAFDIFSEDRGYYAWQRYFPFIQSANTYLDELESSSNIAYKWAINSILLIQIALILIAIPVLVLAYRRMAHEAQFRASLFKHIDQSNRSYLYDDGQELDDNEDSVIKHLVENLKRASSFINSITQGNYSVKWEGMKGKILELNKSNIAGELIMMRDQMQAAKREDDIRIWTNEGLSKFTDLIRQYQQDLHELSDRVIAGIVEYLQAQQGGLFFLNDEKENDKYLELMGCYAYQRKKFLTRRIELGQGMVGQCFLEGETSLMTDVPTDYVNITSGLGETTPACLLIVPLKMNDLVMGVVEIARLEPFEQHQINFLERLGETIASALANVKTNEKTRLLLKQSQEQTEQMRSQEEEMMQNMEELQATQEQMFRKNEEVEKLLQEASENEEKMRLHMETMTEMEGEAKTEAHAYRDMMMDILNQVPDKVFLKDAEGKMYIANQKVADAHGIPLSELIGMSDYDFVDQKTADEWRKQELEILMNGEARYTVKESIGGRIKTLETIKKPFFIQPLNEQGLLGIQREIVDPEQPKDNSK
jgi:CHASE3 domain sensor protein/putative methionine-R-sulfoxide reductase with GAF domain